MRLARTVLPVLTALILGSGAATAQVVNVTAVVDTSRTWGPTGSTGWVGTTFWVKNSISISAGKTLTIQPGVVVKFSAGASLTVYGSLRANGVTLSPIYLTSIKDDNNPAGDTNGDGNITVPNTGDWVGLVFPASSPRFGSSLANCNLRYTGAGNCAALTFQSVSDSVTNCSITKSYYGIDCQGPSSPVLSSTTIGASTMTPIVLDFTATPVFSSMVFSSSDNGYDAIGLRGGTLDSVRTLPKRGALVGANPISNVTYVLLSSLTISTRGSLTVSPGVVMKPLSGLGIAVAGNLTMVGTSAPGDTITFTSVKDDNFGQPNDTNNNGSITAPARGDWGGISFAQGATGSLSYCRLKFGTNTNTAGLVQMLNVSINVSNSLLSDASHGLAILGISSPAVSNVAINNCSSTPVLESVSATVSYSGITFAGNSITAVGLQGENIAVDSHLGQRTLAGYANITYYLMNGLLRMLSGATLTVDPGVVIKNQLGVANLQIDGALVANGTPGALIVFTSERDDQYGNPADTNGDGATTLPAPGDWGGIRFTDSSDDATCILNYCRVAYTSPWDFYGCPSYAGSINITNASPTITHTQLFRSGYGIRIEGNSSPELNTTTFDNLAYAPIIMSIASTPHIATTNIFTSNGYNSIALISETLSSDAVLDYRPAVGNSASTTFCYTPTGPITIPSGVTLSIAPQVILKPVPNIYSISYTCRQNGYSVFIVNGALNMVGSNSGSGRIILTSYLDDATGGETVPAYSMAPSAGDWGNIQFNDTAVDTACIVRNVKFQFGGGGATWPDPYNNFGPTGVIATASASPRCANLEFFQNVTAFTFTGTSAPTLDSLNIFNCTRLPITFSLLSHPVYGQAIAFANCVYLGLGILGGTLAQDVTLGAGAIGSYSNLNYILAGDITVAFGATWTIRPGVVIKLGRYGTDPTGSLIDVSGALRAIGTSDSLIVFTSLSDDAFGQDVMSDGASTLPTPGQWRGIQFEAISNDTLNRMDYCRLRYGSANYNSLPVCGAIICINASPTITNTQITKSLNAALYIAGNATPQFTSVDCDSSTGWPVAMSLVSDPVFTNCRFLGNGFTGLGILPETIAQDVYLKIRSVGGRANMPYGFWGTVTIGLGATLTIQPGVIVKCTIIGPNSSNSPNLLIQRAITALGGSAPESLIVFTSMKDDFYGGDSNMDSTASAPAVGDWTFVQIDPTAIDSQVNFRNCVFRFGRPSSLATTGTLRCVSSAPTVDSCLFAYNGIGISAEGASNPLVRGCSFIGNTSYAINNSGASFCVSAPGCWWGSPSGPNDASATADLCGIGANPGTGDVVSNNVDYRGFATTGTVNPMLGDVSLNGFVTAYDGSLMLQSTVALITLSPLQALVGDVDATAGVTAFDATLVQQYLAGKIAAFPPLANGARHAPSLPAGLRAFVDAARGSFVLALGAARREGDEWLVPVTVTGTAPAYSVELALAGGDATSLVSVTPAGDVPSARNVVGGTARVAMAAMDPIATAEAMVLHFAAGTGEFHVPTVTFARVNENTLTSTPAPEALPSLSFLGRPSPNPAKGAVALQLAVAAADASAHASVRIVDISGRTLRTLVNGPLAAGTRTLEWNLADDAGRVVPAGMYFVRARMAGSAFTQRLIVVR